MGMPKNKEFPETKKQGNPKLGCMPGVVQQHALLRLVLRKGFSDSETGFAEGSQKDS